MISQKSINSQAVINEAFHQKRTQPAPMQSWPGAEIGVRAPMQDETPLSQSEVDCIA